MTLSRSGRARLRALVLSFATLLAAGMPVTLGNCAHAQSQRAVPVIDAPSIFEFETTTTSPMSILITPEKSAPPRAMLLIRGLPSTVSLTEGRVFASGVWSVKLTDLPNLKIITPSSMETTNITLSLVTLEGSILAEKSAILSIATPLRVNVAREEAAAASPRNAEPASKPGSTTRASNTTETLAAIPSNSPPAPAVTGTIRPQTPLNLEETEKIQVFMQKGEENVRSGNINLARLFYKRSADAGWAPGALALAGTYDPEELARMEVVGIKPDPALAKKWYEVARDLGSATAQQKLQRLGQR